MAAKDIDNPIGQSAPEERTIRQSSEGVAAAVALSREAAEQSDLAPKISGYVLKDLMGEGAYGQVWRGVQVRTRKEVAIKVFIQRRGLDWIFLQREVERLARLDRHPHVVTLLDTDLESEPPFYVMDLIEGGSLHQFVSAESPAPQDRTIHWMEQICEALSYVHGKGLIHCDLKPANILLDEQGSVRVVDFGQSRVFTESAASLGTLYYMAPEQAQLGEPGKPVHPDVRWDVYALGATIYAILFGKPPRASDTRSQTLQQAETLTDRLDRYRAIVEGGPIDMNPGRAVNRELFAIIVKCLAAKPEHRYEAVAEVLNDLQALRANRPVSPLAGSRGYRIKKFIQRNPFRLGLVAATMVLIPALYIARQERTKAGAEKATNTVAAFEFAPAEAYAAVRLAPDHVKSQMIERCREYVESPSASLRGIGARAAPVVNPDAFWASVDGGRLWEFGEWLNVIEVAWPESEWLIDMLSDKARNGTDRQKYVAFCLIGQMAGPGGTLSSRGSALSELCASATKVESSPGVLSAASWAAQQLGLESSHAGNKNMFVDELTGLVFARIPPCPDYRRGAAPEDRHQFMDEVRVATATRIENVFFCTTEVTLAAMEPFVNSVASDGVFQEVYDGQPIRETIREAIRAKSITDKTRCTVYLVSLQDARKYCAWLNERAAGLTPPRRYRLPNESEWEYACRGGQSGRFCFGSDERYAPYFGVCNGWLDEIRTRMRMPNWYGLFDMHGGLWEWCDSPYDREFLDPATKPVAEVCVLHGGAYYSPAIKCRSTQRFPAGPQERLIYFGLRLVMELEGQ